MRLLADLRAVFGEKAAMSTEDVIAALNGLEEAPWSEIVNGKALNALGLAQRLRQFSIGSKNIRIGDKVRKGYAAEDLADAWSRYLPHAPRKKAATSATDDVPPPGQGVADDTGERNHVADSAATGAAAQKPWRCGCGSYERYPARPADCESWRCLGCGESPPACSRPGCDHPAVFYSDCAHHASRMD